MNATEAQIEERFPVWDALSDFFLDTRLQQDDYERIAKILAASSYTEDELEDILEYEVCPACRINILSPAGEELDLSWIGLRKGQAIISENVRYFGLCSNSKTGGCIFAIGIRSVS
jgi:hypothetical protein